LQASVQIDVRTDSIRHNLAVARSSSRAAALMAVVKTDAYGHGVVDLLTALDDADALAVATVEEGLQLRSAGYVRPIVVLSRLESAESLRRGFQDGLSFVLHTVDQVRWYLEMSADVLKPLSSFSGRVPMPPVWLKLDTGMHRLGLHPEQFRDCRDSIAVSHPGSNVGLMSHFSSANVSDDASVAEQLRAFDALAAEHSGPCSMANSAALLGIPSSHYDWVRPGIMLYGSSPIDGESRDSRGLRPAMTLTAKLLTVRSLTAGQAVGYGATWRSPVDTRIGVVGIGYGDGYRRSVQNGTPVGIDGNRYPVVGRISMDTLCVDLGVDSQLGSGASVELWGESIDIDEVARKADTISYELLCGMSLRASSRKVER